MLNIFHYLERVIMESLRTKKGTRGKKKKHLGRVHITTSGVHYMRDEKPRDRRGKPRVNWVTKGSTDLETRKKKKEKAIGSSKLQRTRDFLATKALSADGICRLSLGTREGGREIAETPCHLVGCWESVVTSLNAEPLIPGAPQSGSTKKREWVKQERA